MASCALDRGAPNLTDPNVGNDGRITLTNKKKKPKPVVTVVLTRLVNLFQTIDKLTTTRSSSKLGGDDAQQLRYTITKLLQYVTGQERIHRDIILKNSAYLDQLLNTMETCADTIVQQNILIILNELIGKTHTSKRISTLVAHGATNALLAVLVEESREQQPSLDLIVSLHQLLAKLGPKDRKFTVKARLSQALPVTLNLVRNYINNAKPLQAFLHVLKLYSANAVNASYLGKNGAVTHLFKVLTVCGKKHLTVLKYTLDALSLLVKSKSNSARAIGQGGVPVLLTMFYDWHRLDTKNRHLTLRKAVLHVLKHITNLKSGRKAFMDADGIRILYTACQEVIDCRDSESIIVLSSHIMRKCFPKNRLSVANLRSAIAFPLPESDFHVIDNGEGQGAGSNTFYPPISTVDVSERVVNLPSHFRTPAGDEEYESSLDNDDDVSSDEDQSNGKNMDSDVKGRNGECGRDDTDSDLPTGTSCNRTWEDLLMYKPFFPELHEFDAILEENVMPVPPEHINRPIFIPTASGENSKQSRVSGMRTTQSASQVANGIKRSPNANTAAGNSAPSRRSLPTYNSGGYSHSENLLRDAMDSLTLGVTLPQSDQQTENSSNQTSRNQYRAKLKSRHSVDASSDSSVDNITRPSAVNVKTGSSIFSLEMESSTSSTKLRSPTRGFRGSTRRTSPVPSSTSIQSDSRVSKQDKSSRTSKTDEWFSAESEFQSSDDPGLLGNGADQEAAGGAVNPDIYLEIADQTVSAGRFFKVAYPDMYGHSPPPYREPLHDKKFGVQRSKVFEDIDRFINPDHIIDRVIYDVDMIVQSAGPTYTHQHSNLINRDEIRLGKTDEACDHLKFNSQFESGNLRKAIQVRQYEYDLVLSPDINTNHHHQWFYFEVSNMEAGMPYRFNIVNCEKLNSQFNFGMRPVMFSVAEALRGRPHWIRAGTEICYYKNHFIRSTRTTGGVRGKSYYTATFTLNFKHQCDIVYLAYHYPYTYTTMQADLYSLEQSYDSSQIYFKNQSLCLSLGGNRVPVLTITNHPPSYDREGIDCIKNRQYIFLSSRVHPGESNASWVMKGTLQYLMSNDPVAHALRDAYIFKIVPMLNPDGVINGSHRCSLVGEDLNRRWLNPCPKLHPTIYHTKGLLQYLLFMNKTPVVFCDYHGHSRRKNVFLYGCSPSQSWMTEDLDNPAVSANKGDESGYKALPRILQTLAPAFSLSNCSFVVEKSKESTARVVVWRQIGIMRSYTMESSYCGCDQGPYKNMHITTGELEEMGQKFCEALVKVKSRHFKGGPSQGSSLQDANSAGRPRSLELEPEVGRYDEEEEDGGDLDLDEAGEDKEAEDGERDDCDDGNACKMVAGSRRGRAIDEERLTFEDSSSSCSNSGESEEELDLDFN